MLNKIHQILNKICKIFDRSIKSFGKLELLHKLFIIFLILMFALIISNNFDNNISYYNIESYDNFEDHVLNKKNNFEIKKQNDIYDQFYAKYYDSIHLNKTKNDFEIGKILSLEKKNKYTKILDVGCGTGYHVNSLYKKKYDVIGVDQSEAMISKAEENYPKCEFIEGNILNNNLFDYGTFTHILCLGRTIYLIKNKATFFENCYSLLNDGGYLIVHLVDRNLFKPYVNDNTNKVLYDPEKYGKTVNNMIVKFNKNMEFFSNYEKNSNYSTNSNEPYSSFNEKFENYKNHSVRKNEINLYIPELSKVISIAKSKGLKVYKKFNMEPVNYKNEYLYVFRK